MERARARHYEICCADLIGIGRALWLNLGNRAGKAWEATKEGGSERTPSHSFALELWTSLHSVLEE